MKLDTIAIVGAGALGLYLIYALTSGKKLTMGGMTSQAPTVTGANRQQATTDTITLPPLTLAQQYAEYGYGRQVAEVYDSAGYLGTQK